MTLNKKLSLSEEVAILQGLNVDFGEDPVNALLKERYEEDEELNDLVEQLNRNITQQDIQDTEDNQKFILDLYSKQVKQVMPERE